MNIMYLTWGETPRSYGVFGSQVIEQFVQNKRVNAGASFSFVSAVPVLHSGFVREGRNYKNELKRVQGRLQDISFHWLPILCSQNFVNSSKNTFRFMHMLSHVFLKRKINELKPDIVHCRSYHAAWAALKVREKYSLNYKIIFDARGLWPEEVCYKNGYEIGSPNHVFLKDVESQLLQQCDITITVSDAMQLHYLELGVQFSKLIYLSADVKKFMYNNISAERDRTDRINICYVGALSEKSWHSPENLIEFFKRFKLLVPNCHLTIVTTDSHKPILDLLNKFNILEYTITSTHTTEELSSVLADMDFGVLPYRKVSDLNERLIGKTMLATKTAEYLAAGLPVIVNSNCQSVSMLLEKYDLGLIYEADQIDGLDLVKLLKYVNKAERFRISSVAAELFDYKLHAEQYKDIYERVVELP